MKLKSVRIQNYRSIRDSNEFDVNDITCLVGKNEAGKTAILRALYCLNPIIPEDGKYDLDIDYPRSIVEDYRYDIDNGKIDPALVVQANFILEESDLEELKGDWSNNIVTNLEFKLSKGYDNQLQYYFDIDEHAFVDAFLKKLQLSDEILKTIEGVNSFSLLAEKLSKFSNVDEIINHITEITSSGLLNYLFVNYFEKRVPVFLYFDEYYQMAGSVNIQKLLERKNDKQLLDSDHPILGLIELARIDLEKISTAQNTEVLISKLEGASNHLTSKVLEYWSQNKYIELKFDIRNGLPHDPLEMRNGLNILGRVWNTKHKVSIPIGTRSKGFIWFFSFLAWFSTQKWEDKSIILLLDEPALYLHAKAQEDMLRFMERELKPEHQVIYTTHSPFMVDSKRFDRARIVEDKSMESDKKLPIELEGTKVITDVLESDSDSIFPLQAALGYEIYQTLFVSPNCLVVEGISDLLYLQTMSEVLSKLGRTHLDLKWTITPVGGSDKVPTFIALLGSQNDLNVATLLDIQRSDKQKIENLYKKKLLQKKQVLTYGDFTDLKDADVEDMFDEDFYLSVINKEYKSELPTAISISDLSEHEPKILTRLEKYFEKFPLKNGTSFSHYRPARCFAENISEFEKSVSEKTLNQFEKAFISLNKLLK